MGCWARARAHECRSTGPGEHHTLVFTPTIVSIASSPVGTPLPWVQSQSVHRLNSPTFDLVEELEKEKVNRKKAENIKEDLEGDWSLCSRICSSYVTPSLHYFYLTGRNLPAQSIPLKRCKILRHLIHLTITSLSSHSISPPSVSPAFPITRHSPTRTQISYTAIPLSPLGARCTNVTHHLLPPTVLQHHSLSFCNCTLCYWCIASQ